MRLHREQLADPNALAAPATGAALAWLGQAGFLIVAADKRIVIDAYLSDSLAEKYRGTRFPHVRMMAPPVAPGNLTSIDWLLCTHGHADHMDPGTIPALMSANPACRVLVPRSERARAIERGVPEDRLLLIDAGERLILDDMRVTATLSAHEAVERDEDGNCRFLGYALEIANLTIWHSGDTIPFPELGAELQGPVDLALLPINGRDAIRAANGVPGNLTLGEAVMVSDRIGARALICHHFGLFDFNTADPDEAQAFLVGSDHATDARLAEFGVSFRLEPGVAASRT